MLTLSEKIKFDFKVLDLMYLISTKDEDTNVCILNEGMDKTRLKVDLERLEYGLSLFYTIDNWRRSLYLIRTTDKPDVFRGIDPFVNENGIYCTSPHRHVMTDELPGKPSVIHTILSPEEYDELESTVFQLSTVHDLNLVRAMALQTKLVQEQRVKQYIVNCDAPEHVYNNEIIVNLTEYLEKVW